MSSLQDQLMKAGLVDQKQAKKVNRDKRKQEKLERKSKQKQVDEAKLQAHRAQEEKAERDRQLNREREAQAEQRAIAAQIRQMIEVNRQSKDGGRGSANTAYNFTDNKKIKKIYVAESLVNQLTRGHLAIVRLGEEYELVPRVVAEKIRQRDESVVLVCHQPQSENDEDDPYADYQIPDDLMW